MPILRARGTLQLRRIPVIQAWINNLAHIYFNIQSAWNLLKASIMRSLTVPCTLIRIIASEQALYRTTLSIISHPNAGAAASRSKRTLFKHFPPKQDII